ncbi:MAG: Asp23/Gls24 family envelope stress response protein [Christensenellales bacterium]
MKGLSNKELKLEKGNLTCDNKILASIVSIATKEINGVASLSDVLLNKVQSVLTKTNVPGVNVRFTENGGLIVDVYITIYSGFSVPDVSYRIQENVKSQVAAMIDIPVKKINVNITGVDFSKPKSNN